MKRFVIIVNGFQPLTIITKHSILDVVAALDPPLNSADSSSLIENLSTPDFNGKTNTSLVCKFVTFPNLEFVNTG